MSPRLVFVLATLAGCGGEGKCGGEEGEITPRAASDYTASVTEYDVYEDTWFIPSADGAGAPGAVVSGLWPEGEHEYGFAYAWIAAPFDGNVGVTDPEVPRWSAATTEGSPDDIGAVGGDVDADGRRDLVFSWRGHYADESSTYLLSGPEADGTLPARVIAYTRRGSGMHAGLLDVLHDIDGDGVDEVLVGVELNNQTHATLLPQPVSDPWEVTLGTDLLQGPSVTRHPGSPLDAQYDIDGDGYVDIVGPAGEVFLGGADPVASTASMYASYPGGHASPGGYWLDASSTQRVGDLNGDGRGDLVFGDDSADETFDNNHAPIANGAAYAWFGGSPGVHSWLDADLVFTNDGGYTQYGSAWGVADADGSGYADVVLGYSGYGQYDPGDGFAVFLDPALGGCGSVSWNSAALAVEEPDSEQYELGLEVGFLVHDGDGVLDVFATGITRRTEEANHRERVVYVYELADLL